MKLSLLAIAAALFATAHTEAIPTFTPPKQVARDTCVNDGDRCGRGANCCVEGHICIGWRTKGFGKCAAP
ncbi:hypothetical protein PG984_012464 [Apiospora sp. TS-2023a]